MAARVGTVKTTLNEPFAGSTSPEPAARLCAIEYRFDDGEEEEEWAGGTVVVVVGDEKAPL